MCFHVSTAAPASNKGGSLARCVTPPFYRGCDGAEKGSRPAVDDQPEAARLFAAAARDVYGGHYAAAIEKYKATAYFA
jgi:hypothetical protein